MKYFYILISVLLLISIALASDELVKNNDIFLFTTLSEDSSSLWKLRELVGSIHQKSNSLKLHVFGYRSKIDFDALDEMKLWSHVKFVDISETLQFKTLNIAYDTNVMNRYIIMSIFEYSFNEEDAEISVFIENGFLFSEQIIQSEGKGSGFETYSRKNGFKTIIYNELHRLRYIDKYIENVEEIKNEVRLTIAKEGQNGFCSIKIREELVFSDIPNQVLASSVIPDSIAFLIPSANFKFTNVKDIPLAKKFIKSFLKTVTNDELKKFKLRLYVGYDKGDPIFDINGAENRDYIKKLLPFEVFVEFVMLPKTNWLTFIWNRLFVQAYMDGYKYFLQINDDVEFVSNSWITKLTNLSADNISVVGLFDNSRGRNCGLFTQALVNRHHFKIFKGQLFPLTLKDWYSDDWITNVYSDHSTCAKSVKLNHRFVPTRYTACTNPKSYKGELKVGIEKVKFYMKNFVRT